MRPQVSDPRTLELQLPPFLPHLAAEQAFQTRQWLFWGIKTQILAGPRSPGDPSPAASRPPPSSSPPAPPPQPSWPSAASYLAPGFGPACAPGLASPTPRSPSAFSSPLLSSAAAALPGSAHPGQLPDQGPGGNLALAAASGVHSPTPRHVIKNRPYFPGLQWLSSDPTTALRNPRCGALSSNPAL